MIIEIERSGGFSGISKWVKVDTDNIPKSDAVRIVKMIQDYNLHRRLSSDAKHTPKAKRKQAADYFTYKVSVVDNEKRQNIECNEITMRSELQELINYLLTNSPKWMQ